MVLVHYVLTIIRVIASDPTEITEGNLDFQRILRQLDQIWQRSILLWYLLKYLIFLVLSPVAVNMLHILKCFLFFFFLRFI